MPTIPPLLRFLRSMTKEQREAFAAATGTTVVYLYQLAGSANPNPALQLAHRIVKESNLHADGRITARVYDATVEERREAL